MKSDITKRVVICWYVILLCLSTYQYYTIRSYSAVTAEESAAESRIVAAKFVGMIDKMKGKSDVKRSKNESAMIHHLIRKLAHVYIFFVYAFLNVMFFYLASNGHCLKTLAATLLIGVCGAMVDEFLQIFVSGRAGKITDVIIDSIGTCSGCAMFFLFLKFCKKDLKG